MRIRITALVLLATLSMANPVLAQDKRQDFSAAERLLFMSYQLRNVKPPATLRYEFRKSGSLEAGFTDRVSVALSPDPDRRCCAAHTEFLSGEQRLNLPDLPSAEGNPVVLHFLEREVREMQRLTRGSQMHFRKRIRMAVYGSATVQAATLRYKGRDVAGTTVRFSPFLDDPNRPRYENLARKEYLFTLSDAVPGGIHGIRTVVPAADGGATPLLVETLYAEGADPPNSSIETR